MIPKYEFRMRDAAQLSEAKRFTDVVISTGRFRRNERSQIVFEASPGDWCLLERKQGLAQILADGDVIEFQGSLDDALDTLWIWLTARKHTLQRHNPHLPWQDSRPPFVNRGRDCA